jgi:RimJ/RimL family protein N-acetyltransferase
MTMHSLEQGHFFRLHPRAIRTADRSRDIPAAGIFGRAPDRIPDRADRLQHAAHPTVCGAAKGGIQREIVIETPRLILRRPSAADFIAYWTICADPEMSHYTDHGPATSEQAWMRLLRHVGHWSLFGYGFLVVEEKATGLLVGEAGLSDFRRRLGPDLDEVPEAGWAIARSAWGHGYATEAMTAALGWMESQCDVQRTVCVIHSENIASIRVATKLGYRPIGECIHRGYRALTFERRRA